jgi:hypothetical protein
MRKPGSAVVTSSVSPGGSCLRPRRGVRKVRGGIGRDRGGQPEEEQRPERWFDVEVGGRGAVEALA